MTEHATSWDLVATVDEPPALVQAFVAWHLALGAKVIHLYFDRPDDPAADLFTHLPQVRVTRCDSDHWAALGGERPHRHEVRQVVNARQAYGLTDAGWLLHADADEFLWCPGGVGAVLQTVPDAIEAATYPVAERIFVRASPQQTVFDGPFRRAYPGDAAAGRAVFGADYDLTNRGFTGHTQGKAFARTGRDLSMSIHRPKAPGRELHLHRLTADQMLLLHVEGLTRTHWVFKLKRMAQAVLAADGMPPSPHRARQIAALLHAPGRAGALHDRLKVVDPALLRQHELLSEPAFDVAPALARCFPGVAVDLSPKAVDRWLADQKSDVLGFRG